MRLLRTEKEIMQNWQGTLDKPLVSICCITYNHEPYIEDALEGFLIQETDFPFEILIHDDASTDKTADIIREYEQKYPRLIKPICQTENQYSKGCKVNAKFNFPRAKGKYIALCEGDDYWTSPYKLQIQVEYMESNPGCTLCFHAADIVKENKEFIKVLKPYSKTRICKIEDVICKKTNYPTASLMFPTKLTNELPEFYYSCPVGDVPLQLYLSSKGYAYYINKRMSSYRTGVSVSWNTKINENPIENIFNHYKKMKSMYKMFNTYSNNKYEKEVIEAIERRYFSYLILIKNYDELKKPKYNKYYLDLSLMTRIKLNLNKYFPRLYEFLRKVKRRIM